MPHQEIKSRLYHPDGSILTSENPTEDELIVLIKTLNILPYKIMCLDLRPDWRGGTVFILISNDSAERFFVMWGPGNTENRMLVDKQAANLGLHPFVWDNQQIDYYPTNETVDMDTLIYHIRKLYTTGLSLEDDCWKVI